MIWSVFKKKNPKPNPIAASNILYKDTYKFTKVNFLYFI